MTKVIIFTEIGGFHLPDLVAWHLIIHSGWRVFDSWNDYANMNEILSGSLIRSEYEFCDAAFYVANPYEKEIRTNPDIVAAFEYWNPKEFKCVEIPDGIEWYIDEADCGSETIHEKHRWWG
jgi:hypothetical protein